MKRVSCFLNSDNEKEGEIEEIQRKMEYLRNTDRISLAEKIAITKRTLLVIEKSEAEREAVLWLQNKR